MGSAVARRLIHHGCEVLTNLDGRSPQSVERASQCGMKIVPLADIAAKASWLLSILPPDKAEDFAQQFLKEASSSGPIRIKFAECNAVNPLTTKRIAALCEKYNVPFVDASIIGGPPKEGYRGPTFYVSADDKAPMQEFLELGNYGLKIIALEEKGAGVGAASALKMSYAGITKGSTGLLITMVLAAHANSPATSKALLSELLSSQPLIAQRAAWAIPDALPKAYRFDGEMDEISQFVSDHVGEEEGKIHSGLASLYRMLAKSAESSRVLSEFAKQAVEGLEKSK